MVNFEEEYGKIGDSNGANYYKPVEGKQVIEFMDDGVADVAHFKNEKTGVDEEKDRVTFAIMVNKQPYCWSVFPPKNVPYSKTSLYAQLMTCGKAWGGLKGKSLSLIVMGQGMKRRYTVVEASDLQEKIEKTTVGIK